MSTSPQSVAPRAPRPRPRTEIADRMSPKSRRRSTRRPPAPRPSGRYTPPARKLRFRPTWHKVVGFGLVAGGAALFFICQFNVAGIHDYSGHIWYLVGAAIAG